jgi:small subunit ribosomal protein S4
MTKRLNAKYKLDRRLGENIWGRPKSPVNKREYGPGQHGQRRKSKISDFGTQLRAKQKLKGYYANITERQFSKYYEEASRMTGNTSENLIGLLERRIDAVVYRAKFAMTMFAARQLVSHGHVKVNGKRVTIASIQIKVGDTVELSDKARDFPVVGEALATSERDTPDYVETNGKDNAKLTRIPSLGDVPYPVQMQPALVVEYYSR